MQGTLADAKQYFATTFLQTMNSEEGEENTFPTRINVRLD